MSCNSEYRTLKDYMAWTSIPCPRNPLSELFFVIFYMIAFFILLRWFMGIKTHLSNSSRLWNYTASQERKQIKEYFSLFPMTFEWYLWLADIWHMAISLTDSFQHDFQVLGRVTSHLLDSHSIRDRAAYSTSYQTTWSASWEICMQVRKQQLELDMEQQTSSK